MHLNHQHLLQTLVYIKATFTLKNNNISLINILWSMKKFGKKNIKLINTSTTGVYGQPNFKIPEGFVKIIKRMVKIHCLLLIWVDLGII